MTARRAGVDISQSEIIGGQPPGPVIAVLEILASTLLNALLPGDQGTVLLEPLGLLAAGEGAPRQ